jgi:atypical dual specificity phosphatase
MARPDGRPEEIDELLRQGVGAVVNLTRRDIGSARFAGSGIDYIHMPVTDFMPPEPDQVRQFVEFCDAQIRRGRAVVVHCIAGRGRTGTMLACYLVHRGLSAGRAIRRVRKLRPGSIETYEQEQAIKSFAESEGGAP